MLVELIRDRRDAVLAGWLDRILATYPDEGARFMRSTSDPFHNPIGTAIREELGELLEGVLGDSPPQSHVPSLDRLIRPRAIQDFPPSRAVGIVFSLKEAVRDAVPEEVPLADDRWLDRRIDGLAGLAFDLYMQCREKVCEIRVQEYRNRSITVLERLNSWRESRASGGPEDPASPGSEPLE
jgi:hypothetical protein